MTEIKNAMNTKDLKTEDGREPITIETAKVIQGMSLVFRGALTMLEALRPHVSLAPSTALDLVTGNIDGLEKAVLERQAAAEQAAEQASDCQAADAQESSDGTMTGTPAVPAGDDPAPAEAKPEMPSVTVDDFTKIIVQKIKKDRSNNTKIGAILKAFGVSRISELPVAKYEAFVTELSAI